ncbi:Serine/threonine-protein phosphatase 7 long form-like protein, partial [Mucuna pruriens]
MPDKSSNKVHIIYLSLLTNFSHGSTCLATLYRKLCHATSPYANVMGGCIILLQSWAWYLMSFIAPMVNHGPTYLIQSLSQYCTEEYMYHSNLLLNLRMTINEQESLVNIDDGHQIDIR